MPTILEGNVDVVNIYAEVSGQYIMGPNGPVDIRIEAIHRIMDDNFIPENLQLETRQRVRRLIHHMMEFNRDRANSGN